MSKVMNISRKFQPQLELATSTLAFLAIRGAGKTYTAKVFAEEMLKGGVPITCIDPTGAWWGLRSSANGKEAGFPIVVFGGDHADMPLNGRLGSVVARMVVEENLSCVVDLKNFDSNREEIMFLTDFFTVLYRLNTQPRHLFIDEADHVAPQKPFPEQMRVLGAVDTIVRRGRIRGLGVSMISQRPAVLNKNVLSQIETLMALRMTSNLDLDAVKAWLSSNASGFGEVIDQKDIIDSLPHLNRGEVYVCSPSTLRMFTKQTIRRLETFDSSATPEIGKRLTVSTLAEVNIDRLKAALEEAQAKHQETDPKALAELAESLRKERQQLFTELSIAKNQLEQAQVAMQSLQQQLAERPVEPDHDALVQAVQAELSERLLAAENEMYDAFSRIKEKLLDTSALVLKGPGTLALTEHRVPGWNENARLPDPSPAPKMLPAPANRPAGIPKGELAILKECASYPSGCTRSQLTVLTGYKRSSRDAYIQRLSEKDYIQTVNGRVCATQKGVTALGSEYRPMPRHPKDLIALWRNRLPAGELRVFEIMLQSGPRGTTREAISKLTEYARSSRDAYIQRLSAKEIVESDSNGVRLKADFF